MIYSGRNLDIINALPMESRKRMYHAQWYKRSKMPRENTVGMSVQDVPITEDMIQRVLSPANQRFRSRNGTVLYLDKNGKPKKKAPRTGSLGNQNASKQVKRADQRQGTPSMGFDIPSSYCCAMPTNMVVRKGLFKVEKKKIEISFD